MRRALWPFTAIFILVVTAIAAALVGKAGGEDTSTAAASTYGIEAIEARKNAGTRIKYLTPSELAAIFEAANPPLPPVYLTIVSHNEEPEGGRPDYTADRNFYLQNRNLVKLLAETITSRGATFNFQSDWNYLKAVAMYDVGSVTDNTGGKNIVRWMREALGVEVDPHAHETQFDYADVAYLIEQLSVAPSKTVGGFLYDPPDNDQGWEQHINGIYGWVYPSYFWRADHLWGAATYLHLGNDDKSSGIWRPKDRYNFYVDDSNQRLLYIGGCNGQAGLLDLLNDIETGVAPADGFYTANLMMIQDFMTAESIAQLGSFIDWLAPYVAQGRVGWVTLSQMADLWRTQYGSRPFRYDCASVAPTPTPTPTAAPAPVGGVAEFPDVAEGAESPARTYIPLAAGAAVAVVAIAAGAWYARRRRQQQAGASAGPPRRGDTQHSEWQEE